MVVLQLYPAQAQEAAPSVPPPSAPTDPKNPVPPDGYAQSVDENAESLEAQDESGGEPESPEAQDESGTEPEGVEKLETDSNPLNPAGDSLDHLIQHGINADLWQQMRGNLPCVDATTECIAQLQETATQQNPLLLEIDARIEEIAAKIEEAKAENKKSIKLSVLRPSVRVFLEPTASPNTDPNNPVQSRPQPLEKIAQIFTSPVGIINELLSAVGIPLFDSLFGGSDQNQERAIAISDLAVKLAEIQRSRAELAQQVKEKVALAVFDFDTSRREFQISSEVSKREAARMQLIEVEYRLGSSSSEVYLSQLSSLDMRKAQTFRAWASLRSQLEKIRLLVLGTEG